MNFARVPVPPGALPSSCCCYGVSDPQSPRVSVPSKELGALLASQGQRALALLRVQGKSLPTPANPHRPVKGFPLLAPGLKPPGPFFLTFRSERGNDSPPPCCWEERKDARGSVRRQHSRPPSRGAELGLSGTAGKRRWWCVGLALPAEAGPNPPGSSRQDIHISIALPTSQRTHGNQKGSAKAVQRGCCAVAAAPCPTAPGRSRASQGLPPT